jgi:hypothetical protein
MITKDLPVKKKRKLRGSPSSSTRAKMSASQKGKPKSKHKFPMSIEEREMRSARLKGVPKSLEARKNMSDRAKRCNSIRSVQTPEAKIKHKESMQGILPWNTGKKMPEGFAESVSKRMKGVIRTPEHNAKLGLARTGSKNHFWKGGIAVKNADIRAQAMQTAEYKGWRRLVLQRDNKTCQHKDENCLGPLNVDHIKPWATHKELRFEVSNGRVLCQFHHRQTDTYGGRVFYKKKAEIGAEKVNI